MEILDPGEVLIRDLRWKYPWGRLLFFVLNTGEDPADLQRRRYGLRNFPVHPLSSFHRYAFREIPGLVHVIAAQNGDVVSEELEWNAGDERHEHRERLRNADDVIRERIEESAVFRGDRNDAAAASLDFTDVREHLVESVLRGGDHDRHVRVDEARSVVLHLRRG